MFDPVAVFETFFGVVTGRISVMGFDKGFHVLYFVNHSSSWVIDANINRIGCLKISSYS